MGLNIISNFAANRALTNLNESSGAASLSVAKLSSGSRIVTAADDAASLAIGSRLRAEMASLEQAVVNAGQATSLLQIADGALGTTQDILTRLRALSVQAGSENLADIDRRLLDVEFTTLVAEIDRIAADTEFNGQKLLSNQNEQLIDLAAANDPDGFLAEDAAGSGILNVTIRNFLNDDVASGGDGSFVFALDGGSYGYTGGGTAYGFLASATGEAGADNELTFSAGIDSGLVTNPDVAATVALTTGTTLIFRASDIDQAGGGDLSEFTLQNAELVISLDENFDLGDLAAQDIEILGQDNGGGGIYNAFGGGGNANAGQLQLQENSNANQADFRANHAAGDYVF